MSLKKYLTGMTVATIITWLLFIFILSKIDPEITNWIGFLFFYFALFLGLSGTISILGFLIRKKIMKETLIFYSVKSSFRQSFLFSFLVVAVLFMLAENLFSWLNIIILIAVLSILEYILISKTK